MPTTVADPPAGTPTDSGTAPPPRTYDLATLVVAVVAALLVGFAAGVVALRPAATPDDTSPEAGFARDMITHHAQAVDMGQIAYDRAELPAVRQIGYDIATMQQGQIGMMQQWLREWDVGPNRSDPPMAWMASDDLPIEGSPMPGMATSEQMQQLREAEGLEVDRLFLELMITHHLGGIHMVDGVLDRSNHDEVAWLAGMMKDGQQRELEVLRNLQDEVEAADAG